jgi:glycosyltransferase involved in cell wall biosynthesis
VTVAASLIVRDAAETLERCLASVRPHVDEVCVLDTGSTDGTLALLDRLAGEPGPPLRVESAVWQDDFAAARERSFALVAPAHDWILWIDDDDELVGGDNVRAIVARAKAAGAAAVLAAYDHHARPDGTSHYDWSFRIVRRGTGRWEGVVHEHWRGPDPRQAVVAHPAALRWRHFRREQRPGHYLHLLERATSDPARTPRAWFYLGRELMLSDRERAAKALETYLERGDDAIEGRWNPFRVAALNALAELYASRGDLERGRRTEAARRAYLSEYQAAVRRDEVADPDLGRWLSANARAWAEETPAALVLEPPGRTPAARPGRNDPCWCGSGRKFKRCHGA